MCIIDSIIDNLIIVHYCVYVLRMILYSYCSFYFFFLLYVDCHLYQVIFILECKLDIVIGAKVFIANSCVVKLLLSQFK